MNIVTNKNQNIYFIITIDTECDKGPEWIIQRPLKFRSVIEGIPNRLEPIFKEFGAQATYLLSPEVMQNDECLSVLKDVQKNGGELGTHLHGEFIEPYPNEEVDATGDMQNIYSREIEAEKLKNLTKLFIEKFGYCPSSFRAGRFGIGKKSLSILSDIGYSVDSSVAPYCQWKDKGGNISFFGSPIQPYFPDANDFLNNGNLPILEVPVTIGRTWWEYFPQVVLRTVPKYPLLWGVPIKYLKLKKKFKPKWLRPTWSSFKEMRELINTYLQKNSSKPVVLVMMFHNVEVISGCSPGAQNESEVEIILSRLKNILHFAQKIQAKFITLSEIRNIY